MKKEYISPELEVLLLRITDIITASPTGGAGTDEDDSDYDTPIDPFVFGDWD